MHAIDGIPKNCQILHVEQEVVGDDTPVLQCVLNSDMERTQLLEEEAHLLALQVKNIIFQITNSITPLNINWHNFFVPTLICSFPDRICHSFQNLIFLNGFLERC